MAGQLEGKVALVTGGGSGIGRATALTFAREGAKIIVSDIVAEGGEETVRMIKAAGSHKVQVDPTPGLRDRPAVQAMVATSAAELDAARLLLHHALGDLWDTCRQGKPVSDLQRARMWSGAIHAGKKAKAVVTAMYEAAGVSALYVDCPIERAHRDIHAVA